MTVLVDSKRAKPSGFGLKFGLFLFMALAAFLTASCGRTVVTDLLSGASFRSMFGFDTGPQYAVLRIMTNVMVLVIVLFLVLLMAACFSWVYAWVTGLDVPFVNRAVGHPKFHKSKLFPVIVIFNAVFAALCACDLVSYLSFDPIMIDGGDATMLILVLFGPLLLAVLFGVCIVELLGVLSMFVIGATWYKPWEYIMDCLVSLDPEYEVDCQRYDGNAKELNVVIDENAFE